MTRKVLIAEDEPNILISLEFLLRQSNYEVRAARDGEEALRLVESFSPDLVLLDVMMPARNGFEVCEKIRDNPAWRGVKIVMLTAKGRAAEIEKGLALGADAYLSKPFSTKELLGQVRELLGEAL
ncbi:MAG TPA: response regulator [Burkholderiales bacterium]